MQSNNRFIEAVIIGFLLCASLLWAHKAWSAEPIDVEGLATAIHKAEGNDNYGILKRIKGKNYRKACIQTIQHAMRDYSEERKAGQDFISFLGSRYAPINMGKNSNDPKNLNANWVRNVRYFLAKK